MGKSTDLYLSKYPWRIEDYKKSYMIKRSQNERFVDIKCDYCGEDVYKVLWSSLIADRYRNGTYRNTSYGVDSGAVRRLPGEIVVEVSEVG